MVRILITGATGFAGRFLAQYLASTTGVELHGLARHGRDVGPGFFLHRVDLLDTDGLRRLVQHLAPQRIFHLAAFTDAGGSFRDARRVWDANFLATLNLYDACLALSSLPRIVFVSTGAVYGEAEQPITEPSPLRPNSPYAASKAAADLASYQYFVAHGLPIIRVRAFNQVGPGQPTTFALGRFVEQLVRMERGQLEPVLRVGNLEAERDFTDVRDMAHAYIMLMEKGEPGEVYNAASGTSHSMNWYLDQLLALTRVKVTVETDPSLLRPVETQHLRVETSALRRATGWQPVIPLTQSLKDLFDETRRSLS